MFLKAYGQIFIFLFLIFYVKGIPLQDDVIHSHHGSLYQNINYAQHNINNQQQLDSQFQKLNFLTTHLASEGLHKEQKPISPDTYNLDQVISNLDTSKLIESANKYKADNLYTLALPKMNYGRPKHYYVFRDNDLLLNDHQPHRFSNLAIKSQINSNEADLSDLQHHADLKNIIKSYPELFESVTLKNFPERQKIKFIKPETFSNLNGGGKLFSRDVNKNKYLLSTDVSHVKFSGMGTSYEF